MVNATGVARGAEEIALFMRDVVTARPRDRAAAFSRFRTAFESFLIEMDGAVLPNAGRLSQAERERFPRQAEVYLRALSTYSVTSDAWINVFHAFRRMFDMHVFGRPRNDLLRADPHNPLRPNPELLRYVRT
jgi:hypothetical protein